MNKHNPTYLTNEEMELIKNAIAFYLSGEIDHSVDAANKINYKLDKEIIRRENFAKASNE